MLRIAFVEWPEGLSAPGPQWDALKNNIIAAHPDLLITSCVGYPPSRCSFALRGLGAPDNRGITVAGENCH